MDVENSYKLKTVGKYQLSGKVLGKGNYSVVKEAVDRNLNKNVALKIISVHNLKDRYMKQNYKREAYILSKLNHVNIISITECLETKNYFIMVLDIMPNNLCDFIRNLKRGKFDESTSRILFRQVASAVTYIHEKGIIHRDIKLENILIDPMENKIKLTDFGLSNEWDKKTFLSTNCGSPEYSAPELHACEPYGNGVDVWALGVVLFAMLVGRLPFEIEGKKPVNNKHRHELFLDEMKRGIKTIRHQSYMNSLSYLGKDLISKMLNPNHQKRIQMDEINQHQWLVFKLDTDKFNNLRNHSHSTSTNHKSKTVNRPGTTATAVGITSNKIISEPRPVTRRDQFRSLLTKNYPFGK